LERDGIDLDAYHGILTEERVAEAHRRGLVVNVWTVDDPKVAEKLAEWGVDQITSNILE
jgi:glycerophosphoryl diester phosphodiesterase